MWIIPYKSIHNHIWLFFLYVLLNNCLVDFVDSQVLDFQLFVL